MPSDPTAAAILAVNTGSSSLKLTLFGLDGVLSPRGAATIERIGTGRTGAEGGATGFADAFHAGITRIAEQGRLEPAAIGHRIVHGGGRHVAPEPLTPSLVADLEALAPIDPTHMRQALSVVAAAARQFPSAPQFACFDTAFHNTMPPVARHYPLPRRTWSAGVQRYGFHGLSCESIVGELRAIDPERAEGRVIVAHLGNGASITAIERGVSVDTSMGFSPTGGLMMGTRAGDLDPSVVVYLARTTGASPEALERLLTEESGLLGVSGVSSDMRELLQRDDRAEPREAVALYCYSARKHLGALIAALNGVETIVFTGGIGEHAPPIRDAVCAGLQYAGVQIDAAANQSNAAVISRLESRVTVRVMRTDEDLVIARHVRRLLR